MLKQKKYRYVSLMNRIALALLANQILIRFLSNELSVAESLCILIFGNSISLDFVYLVFECVVYAVSFVVPIFWFNYMQRNAFVEKCWPNEGISLTKSEIFCVIALGLGANWVAAYINHITVNSLWSYSDFSSQYLWYTDLRYGYQVAIYLISTAVIPAVVEELLFRKIVCKSLMVYGNTTAVIVSAALFALMHTNIEQLFYTFVAGIFLGWLYVGTKDVRYPMLLHFINNLISAIGTVIAVKGSPEAYNIYDGLTTIAILIFAVIAFCKLYSKRERYLYKLEMKPDENGEPVEPLSVKEKISGFFSPVMIIFVLFAYAYMGYLIYLSMQLT